MRAEGHGLQTLGADDVDWEAVERDLCDRLSKLGNAMKETREAQRSIGSVAWEVCAGNMDAAIILPGALSLTRHTCATTRDARLAFALEVHAWLDHVHEHAWLDPCLSRAPSMPTQTAASSSTCMRRCPASSQPMNGHGPPEALVPGVPSSWSCPTSARVQLRATSSSTLLQHVLSSTSESKDAQPFFGTSSQSRTPSLPSVAEFLELDEEQDDAEVSLAELVAWYLPPVRRRHRGRNTNGSTRQARRRRRLRDERAAAAAVAEVAAAGAAAFP